MKGFRIVRLSALLLTSNCAMTGGAAGDTNTPLAPTSATSTNSPAESRPLLPGQEAARNTIAANLTATINPATGLPEGGGTNLFTRTFKVDANTFWRGVKNMKNEMEENLRQKPTNASDTNAIEDVRRFFRALGVDLQPPKTMYFNERRGTLLIRASLADLDVIEQAVQVLNQPAPKVNLRVVFVEFPDTPQSDRFLPAMRAVTSATNEFGYITETLTDAQCKRWLRGLEEQRIGAEVLYAPEVTTVSGQNVRVQAGHSPTASPVSHTNFAQTGTNVASPALPVSAQATVDIVPYVSADGFTIQLVLIPATLEPAVSRTSARSIQWGSSGLISYSMRAVTATTTLWDGQTFILGGFVAKERATQNRRDEMKSRLAICVTATIVDPGGN